MTKLTKMALGIHIANNNGIESKRMSSIEPKSNKNDNSTKSKKREIEKEEAGKAIVTTACTAAAAAVVIPNALEL